MRATLNDLATNLANGKVTASHLVEEALARIAEYYDRPPRLLPLL